MTTKHLEITDLKVNIGLKEIVKGVSFSAKKGENISILGPNGAGKTTLLKGMSNLIPSSGTVNIGSQNVNIMTNSQRAKEVCYVPQNSTVTGSFNVNSFVELARYPYRLPWEKWTKEDETHVKNALEITQCDQFSKRDISTLSGGERQRVFIAAAIAQNSPVILFDEPVTYLDPVHRTAISEIIENLCSKDNKLVVNVTHEVNEALLYSSRIIVFNEGQIVFDGDPQQVVSEKVLDDVFKTKFVETIHPVLNKSLLFPGRSQ